MEPEIIDISAETSKRKNDDIQGDNAVLQKFTTTFEHDIIKDVIKTQCTNPKNKITDEAVELVSEIAKALVVEASLRAAKVASNENRTLVTLEDIEGTLPQLILDFP
ncbi:unnamed protein product [Acanthoscelides obtectus]|uniref:Centromere protein X n=1 Tax=Acanthoscelides obtectus TaxID=200917 RepID=A0A9P0M5E4_ACAOB|nr:unnamed protein product [Acanthoscelides obtectus]CAH2005313.1 unnamed protein product [Acanthoscelides obtectus]CAK1657788.1 Centromere protein X [Acanthoscelides obtectus]CAK1657842.1 Centromere protein X [Acanthoscelides obtectus]